MEGSESFSTSDSSAATVILKVTIRAPRGSHLPLSRGPAVGAEPMSSLRQPAKELKQPEKLPDTNADPRPCIRSLWPPHEASERDLRPLPSAVPAPAPASHLGLSGLRSRTTGNGKQYFQGGLSFFEGHVSGIRRSLGFLRGEATRQGETHVEALLSMTPTPTLDQAARLASFVLVVQAPLVHLPIIHPANACGALSVCASHYGPSDG